MQIPALRTFAALSVCVLALPTLSHLPVSAQPASCVAATASGPVQGRVVGGACTYLGIPYAAPPVGVLRWRPPQPALPWGPNPYDATLIRQCPQINMNTGALQGLEDCLTLNVWAPASSPPARGLPVLVWLHTGGFQGATSNFAASDGRRFAEERNAIVVAPNYRLGPFGFLAHRALTTDSPDYRSSGNYGFADQRAALRWVRENIAAFGGDPTNVTLAGTSAGSTSAAMHLVSPASRGLFHRVIMQSAYALVRWDTLEGAEDQGASLAARLGCTNAATAASCLRSKDRDEVLTALPIGQAQFLEQSGRVDWGPVVDGLELPDQPRTLYRRGQFSRIPVVIGTNRDEGWTFVDRSFPAGLDAQRYQSVVRNEFAMDADAVLAAYPLSAFPTAKDALVQLTGDVDFVCDARRIARVMDHDGARVFVYSFDYPVNTVTPGRAFHGLESNLLFGNNFGAPSNHVLTTPDLVVYDAMSVFWRRFMETGDPNARGVPVQWPPYRPGHFEEPVDASRSDRHFVFGDRLGVANYLRDSHCNFWEPFFLRSVRGAVPAAAR